jgi:hypothetical protein
VSRQFQFVQFELPGRVGPAHGRYVVRRYAGDEAQAIVAVSGLEAERRWLPSRRRPRVVDPGAAIDGVEVTRFTVIDAHPLAAARLPADPEAAIGPALALLNRTLAGHRAAAADPWAGEIRREAAVCVRVGYGEGEEVSEGRWTEAVEVPHPKPGRSSLSPQERLAALLAARDVVLTCEELGLRAEGDLAAGRLREAALELRSALQCAVVELRAYAEITGMEDRIAELSELLAELEPVAADAMGPWDEAREDLVRRGLGRLQAALRARLAASGL